MNFDWALDESQDDIKHDNDVWEEFNSTSNFFYQSEAFLNVHLLSISFPKNAMILLA